MKTKMTIKEIISKSLAASKVEVDLEAALAWQKRPTEIVHYLKEYIEAYSPEERRLLYVKSIELSHEEMLSFLISRLQYEEDGPAIKLIETILVDKMKKPDLNRYLGADIHCKSSLAERILRNLRQKICRRSSGSSPDN